MATLARIALHLIEDVLSGMALLLRSIVAVRAENLFLRRQLALYIERGVRPRRVDAAGRISLALLARVRYYSAVRLLAWHRSNAAICH